MISSEQSLVAPYSERLPMSRKFSAMACADICGHLSRVAG